MEEDFGFCKEKRELMLVLFPMVGNFSLLFLILSDLRLFPDCRDFFGLVTCPWVSIKM